MMEIKEIGTSRSVKKLKFVFTLCGLWPGEFSARLSMLYNFYSLSIIVIFLLFHDLSLIVYIFFFEDLEEATNNLCISLTVVTLFGKILNFKIFIRRIQKLLHTGEEFTLENDQESFLVNQRISLYNKLVTFLFFSANIAGSSIYIGASMSDELQLPFLGWYPFDWKSNYTTYVLLYTHQVMSMVIQSNLNISMDLFSAYLMHVASIKLEILGVRLEKLCKFSGLGQLNLQVEHKAALVKCIAAYQHIWKYTMELQKCFTYGFMVQISFSGAVICFVAYQLTNTTPQENFALYTFLVMFQICMITQMSLPCYFGNEIILKHENLTGSIFKCGWHLQSIQYRKNVIILMELVKQKRHILVGNWFVLDLDLFVSIMNFAYRLYALLV